jgi:hypothetical protein
MNEKSNKRIIIIVSVVACLIFLAILCISLFINKDISEDIKKDDQNEKVEENLPNLEEDDTVISEDGFITVYYDNSWKQVIMEKENEDNIEYIVKCEENKCEVEEYIGKYLLIEEESGRHVLYDAEKQIKLYSCLSGETIQIIYLMVNDGYCIGYIVKNAKQEEAMYSFNGNTKIFDYGKYTFVGQEDVDDERYVFTEEYIFVNSNNKVGILRTNIADVFGDGSDASFEILVEPSKYDNIIYLDDANIKDNIYVSYFQVSVGDKKGIIAHESHSKKIYELIEPDLYTNIELNVEDYSNPYFLLEKNNETTKFYLKK